MMEMLSAWRPRHNWVALLLSPLLLRLGEFCNLVHKSSSLLIFIRRCCSTCILGLIYYSNNPSGHTWVKSTTWIIMSLIRLVMELKHKLVAVLDSNSPRALKHSFLTMPCRCQCLCMTHDPLLSDLGLYCFYLSGLRSWFTSKKTF